MSVPQPLQYLPLTTLGQALVAALTTTAAQSVLGLPANLISAINSTTSWSGISAAGNYTYLGAGANREIVDSAKAGITISNSGTGNLVLFDTSTLMNYSLTIRPGETVNFDTVDASGGQFSFTENIRVSIPDASATQPGRVSTGAQTFAGAKTFSGLMQGTAQTADAAENILTRALGDARYMSLALGSILKVEFVTASVNPYNFESGCQYAFVEGVAGGGGGGGALACTSTQTSAGNGGAAGGYGRKWIDVGALSTKSCALVVGASGGGVNGDDGTDGGDSTYTDENGTLTLAGGPGGLVRPVISGERIYTASLLASEANSAGWDMEKRGQSEQSPWYTGILGAGYAALKSGRGGNGPWGCGGNATATQGNSANGSIGANATGKGCGGSGGWNLLGGSDRTGGQGTDGAFLIIQFQ